MKKYALPLALVGLVSLAACNEQMDSTEDATPLSAPLDAVALESTEQRLSYGIAFGLGQRMAQTEWPWTSILSSRAFEMVPPVMKER